MNANLRNASYRLPDGSLVIPGQPPNLSSALRRNQALRSTGLYHLSDNSVLSGAPRPTPPNLYSALKKEEMRGATYRYETILLLEIITSNQVMLSLQARNSFELIDKPISSSINCIKSAARWLFML